MAAPSMETLVSLCKRRGFVFPSSEIYGGYASIYDYGPLGVELKNNIKKAWWKAMVYEHNEIVGLDGAIFTHPRVWDASGHTSGFSDPLSDCKECKKRFRVDHLLEDAGVAEVEGMDLATMNEKLTELDIACPSCGKKNWTEAKAFNLLVKAYLGVTEDAKSEAYLRGETAQTIFVNFKNVQQTSRKKLPMGIAQIGKSFRNEITLGHFIFRMREFEQMEMQYFIKPGTSKDFYDTWKQKRWDFWTKTLGVREENLQWRQHDDNERAFYAADAWDIEYQFAIGFKEVEGVHDRGDYDLKQHAEFSKQDLNYFDPETNEKYLPFVVETACGADRCTLAVLSDAYHEEEVDGETRVVLKFAKELAPIKAAVLPLSNKLNEDAEKVFEMIKHDFNCDFDVTQSIGKRYRRQDEIGTPFCITFDFDSLEDKKVTVRDRDTMEQERVAIAELREYLADKLKS